MMTAEYDFRLEEGRATGLPHSTVTTEEDAA